MLNDAIVYFDSNFAFLGMLILAILILSSFSLYVRIFVVNDINKRKEIIELEIEDDDEEITDEEEPDPDDIDSVV